MTSQAPPYPGFKPELGMPPAYPHQQMPYPPQQQMAYPVQYPGYQPVQQQGQYANPGYSNPAEPHPATNQYAPPPGGQPANYGAYGAPPIPIMPMRLPLVDSADSSSNKDDDLPGFIKFTDKAIRAAFIRKVYLIIMLQLLFSLGVICLFVFERNVKLFVRQNYAFVYLAYFIFLAVYIALACCSGLRRNYPCNMIMLSVFTMAMSYMLGTISSMYDTQVVLLAVGICAGVCLGVSVFSFHTKFDFTSCGGVLCILVWVLFLFGIICIFTYNTIMTTIYAGCGALLFTVFLAYDTQMLMGGKKHELSPEEHIFASMQIYLDIVNIFIFLLSILGSGRSN
ncbi:protein lifeguard 1 [Parasteatoda tepidariorum]|uniref:protein lifeguard 1 n=1 Tax=Parasteatoda tepidariorum TaxID=114398 RepID=UPI00077FC6F4|nr:protein lifeguard 1 [Parasteatoda tepidariorum]